MSQSKSAIGHKPNIAKSQPRSPDGREWWCAPPIAPPSPEHIAYAEDFLVEVMAMKVDKRNGVGASKGALVTKVQKWIKEAKALRDARIAFEEGRQPGDAMPTDELIVQTDRVVAKLFDFMNDAGFGHRLSEEMRTVARQLNRRARSVLNRRVALPTHPVRRAS